MGSAGAEADLYLSYSPVNWLNFTITDYFSPSDEPSESNDYFNYKRDKTGHTIEAMATIGGSGSFPLYATSAMNLYGTDGVNEKGQKYNAKYLEIGYTATLKQFEFAAFAGWHWMILTLIKVELAGMVILQVLSIWVQQCRKSIKFWKNPFP